MAIRLEWVNPNQSYDNVEIYRAQSKVGIVQPGNLLATVPNGTSVYIDTSIASGTSAYYSIVVVTTGGEKIVDYPFNAGNFPVLGVGPTKIKRGDFKSGFFGKIPAADLFTASDLHGELALPRGTVNTGTMNWFKFALNDRILYYPDTHVVSNLYWSDLNNIGAVDGTKIVTRGNFQYRVKLMAMSVSGTIPADTSTLPEPNSEFGQLMMSMIQTSAMAGYQNTGRWGDEIASNFVKQYTMYRDTDATKYLYHNSNTNMNIFGTMAKTTNSNHIWKPLLELVK
jgi:hypothetical protein